MNPTLVCGVCEHGVALVVDDGSDDATVFVFSPAEAREFSARLSARADEAERDAAVKTIVPATGVGTA